jgi:entericidin B
MCRSFCIRGGTKPAPPELPHQEQATRLNNRRKNMRIIAAFTALFALAACETTEGFGRDLSNLGDDIEDEAEEND